MARRTKLNPRRRLLIAGGTVVVAGLVIGGASLASATAATASYRTATAESASVDQVLESTGTIASATRYDLAFGTAGTVATVAVGVGDHVDAGQALGTLDADELQDAIDSAQQTVDDAAEQLADDLDSQSSVTTVAVSSSTSSSATAAPSAPAAALPTTDRSSSGTSGSSGSSAALTAASTSVTAAQDALLAQWDAAAALLVDTDALVSSSSAACQPFLTAVLVDDTDDTDAGGDTAPDTTDSTTDAIVTPTETDVTTPGMTLDEAKAELAACQAAITAVAAGQQSVNAAQAQVMTLVTALDDAVGKLIDVAGTSGASAGSGAEGSSATNPGTSGSTASTASTSSTSSTSGSAAPTSASSGGGTATVTAAKIVADRANIAAAQAELAIAQAAAAHSSLTSPIAGTVAAVSVAVGDSVTASSTTSVITVIGDDGFVASTTVSLGEIASVAVGQTTKVTATSTGSSYAGEVVSIGVLNVSTTTTPAYTVLVSVDSGDDALLNGGSAALAISTASSSDVLTVPIAALHRDGTAYSVDVLSGGRSVSTAVEIGAVGTERAEITSGVSAGATVILADLSQQLESATTTDSGLTGLGGSTDTGRPAGGPPAGFTPGG